MSISWPILAKTREGHYDRMYHFCGLVCNHHEPANEDKKNARQRAKSSDGAEHFVCQAFMDAVTVMTPSIKGTQWIVNALKKMKT